MLVTVSWGDAEVAVEVDAECRSAAALKLRLQEALPQLEVAAVRLEVYGRPLNDEEVLGLSEGSVITISATQAALAAAALREEGCDGGFYGFCGAATASDTRRCKLYLEAGVVSWPSDVENPLHIAVRHDHRELTELLLEWGCANDLVNEIGNTPLHLAVHLVHVEHVKLLLDAGCDKNAKSRRGNTPLHLACSVKSVPLAKLLLDAGCDKDAKNSNDTTPLSLACYVGTPELTKLLVDSGCAKGHDEADIPQPSSGAGCCVLS